MRKEAGITRRYRRPRMPRRRTRNQRQIRMINVAARATFVFPIPSALRVCRAFRANLVQVIEWSDDQLGALRAFAEKEK